MVQPKKCDTIVHAMAVLSPDISEDLPLQKLCVALAQVIADADLTPAEMRQLIFIGGAVWKRAVSLGEQAVVFHELTDLKH